MEAAWGFWQLPPRETSIFTEEPHWLVLDVVGKKMDFKTDTGNTSVQFSHSVVSDSLQPHEPQHARLPVHHQLPEFTQTHDN